MEFRALDDLDPYALEPFPDPGDELSPISLIGPEENESGEQVQFLSQASQDDLGSVTILDIRRVYGHADDQPERINNNVSLPPVDLLSRIVAFLPPFFVFTDWESMLTALGVGSLPA
jgi:hypothetical protein